MNGKSACFLAIICLLLAAYLLAGCATPLPSRLGPSSTPQVQKTRLTALLVGTLIDEQGCLRVQEQESGEAFTLVWPKEYTIQREGDTVRIIDGEGKVQEAQVGQRVGAGGGTAGYDEKCPGPYWMTWSIFSGEGLPTAVPTVTPIPTRPGQSTTGIDPVAGRTPTPTLGPTQVFQTNAVFDRTANAAPNLTSTAIVREIQATVTPRIFQSIRSPDGKWRAEVILYDCAQVVSPDPGYTHAYELLKIASWTVETQLLSCGGQGAAGLGGLFWSANSRFFYYTDAREGWPDGGYPWIRPMSRFDTSTGKDEALSTAVYAPDRQKIAGGQGTDLVIWDIRSGAVTRFSSPHPEQSWINWLSWSPDGRSLVYLTQTNCQDRYPCPSSLTRVDLGTQTQSLLLGEQDPPMLQVDWDGPNQLALFGSDFSTRYIYDLKSGVLSPVPEATLTAAAMNRSTPVPATETPAPTYPPDPAFPADLYPPDNPFRQPIDRSGKDVLGHGCPSLLGVKTQEGLTVETIKPILEAVRTGDVYQIRTHSDIAYWPATGLGLRRQDSFLLSGNIAVQPAIQSPLADGLTQACGAEIARASWWAQVTADDGISDYFLIQRKDRWLVWFRVYDYGQFAG